MRSKIITDYDASSFLLCLEIGFEIHRRLLGCPDGVRWWRYAHCMQMASAATPVAPNDRAAASPKDVKVDVVDKKDWDAVVVELNKVRLSNGIFGPF